MYKVILCYHCHKSHQITTGIKYSICKVCGKKININQAVKVKSLDKDQIRLAYTVIGEKAKTMSYIQALEEFKEQYRIRRD